jgi:hypothetical protein
MYFGQKIGATVDVANCAGAHASVGSVLISARWVLHGAGMA